MYIIDVTIKVTLSTEGRLALRPSACIWSFMLPRDMATMAIELAYNIQSFKRTYLSKCRFGKFSKHVGHWKVSLFVCVVA
jgi:hypothetical protein